MNSVNYPIAVCAIFIWIGFVCAISFMEAWLKFRAPGITIPLGLGIGRLVFNALNKVEWVLALVILGSYFINKEVPLETESLLVLVPFIIVILQTFWLLPVLDARAELHIRGEHVPPSSMHLVFVAAEVIKVTFLIITGYSYFK